MYNVIMFKKFILSVFIIFFSEVSMASCPKSLDFDIKLLGEDKTVNLCQEYLGKVILVVNTASKCGFTYQYEQLEELYRKYVSEGFVVLGFPSRNFLYQEFDEESQVEEFCKSQFDVTFPLFLETDQIYNLACPASPVAYQKNPISTIQTAILGAINALLIFLPSCVLMGMFCRFGSEDESLPVAATA